MDRPRLVARPISATPPTALRKAEQLHITIAWHRACTRTTRLPAGESRWRTSRARKECDVDRLRSLLIQNAGDDTGAVGYILAWLLGIPASVLFLIFLMRGCT